MSRVLIIPDIHTRFEEAEFAILKYPADQIVFLGDYFDNWGVLPDRQRETALWLRESLRDPQRVHLMGNHDYPYAVGRNLWGAGWTSEHQEAISDVLDWDHWMQLRLFHNVDGRLLSHAGLHSHWLPFEGFSWEWAEEMNTEAREKLHLDYGHWTLAIGPCRTKSGLSPYYVGGPLWLDWKREFEPIPGLLQIVGHSEGTEAREKEGNWCLDSPGVVGIIEDDGELSVFRA
jgi:hypothetical protein